MTRKRRITIERIEKEKMRQEDAMKCTKYTGGK